MKYLVMETHPAYAVLLDERGRFVKAANLHYRVGDTVQDVVELRAPEKKRSARYRPLIGAAGLAACMCLAFFGYYQPNFTAYGTVRIQINPDVEMTVSRTDRVLDLEALNADGQVLLQGYSYQGKSRDTATDELVERAIDLGYLSDGDTISITVNSADADWQTQEEEQVRRQLEERYGESIVIELGERTQSTPDPTPAQEAVEVIVPVAPPTASAAPAATPGPAASPSAAPEPAATPRPRPTATNSGADTDYGAGSDGVTDYDDTDYGPNADGVTDYQDTDYGPSADGVTDYQDTDYGPNADGVTDYQDTDGSSNADGATDYGDADGGSYQDGVTDYEDREGETWDDIGDDESEDDDGEDDADGDDGGEEDDD